MKIVNVLKNLDIRSKMVLAAVVSSLVSCCVVAVVALYDSSNALARLSEANLVAEDAPQGLLFTAFKYLCLIILLAVLVRVFMRRMVVEMVKPILQTIERLTRNSQHVFGAARVLLPLGDRSR